MFLVSCSGSRQEETLFLWLQEGDFLLLFYLVLFEYLVKLSQNDSPSSYECWIGRIVQVAILFNIRSNSGTNLKEIWWW